MAEVDQKAIDALISALNNLRDVTQKQSGKKGKAKKQPEVDKVDINKVLEVLLTSVKELLAKAATKEEVPTQVEDSKPTRDKIDELEQRQLKGNILISEAPGSRLIKDDETLNSMKIDLIEHAANIINLKYKVQVQGSKTE